MDVNGANFKMSVENDTDYESLSLEKRFQAAVHYSVAEICNEHGRQKNATFSKRAIATIADLTYRHALKLATDQELFAKHAKRSVINVDDVKLSARMNPKLSERLDSLHAETTTGTKRSSKKRPPKAADPSKDLPEADETI